MEKQYKYRQFFTCNGLLKIFFAVTFFFLMLPMWSQRQTFRIRDAVIKAVNEEHYADEEVLFELVLPNFRPETVQASIPQLPSGVSFISMRRSENTGEAGGTKIELWLSFSEPGTYTISSLPIYINNRSEKIPFLPIEIFENPKKMIPRLTVSFEEFGDFKTKNLYAKAFDSVTGKKLIFTLYVQFALQIISFDYKIPSDSLLSEIKRYDILQGRRLDSGFSTELIPVADFEWTPFVTGNILFPEVFITATTFDGSRVNLSMPEYYITVDYSENAEINTDENIFSYAFIDNPKNSLQNEKKSVTKTSCMEIARLRSEERNSIFPLSAREKRKAYELKCGIKEGRGEPFVMVFKISLSLFFVFLLLSIVFSLLKKTYPLVFTALFSITFCVVLVIYSVRLYGKYGVFVDGEVYPVPEENVEPLAPLAGGKRVQIKRKAAQWCFIVYGNSGGWTQCENVIEIR